MSRIELTAVPLSPIHIGDGTTLTPEAYSLQGESLLRFDPQVVATGLTSASARAFVAAIDRGDLSASQRILREAVKQDQVRERILVSPDSRREVEQALAGTQRRGAVHPFVRGSQGPYVPGSSVKGALRTALLSAWVQSDLGRYQDWMHQQNIRNGRSGIASNTLQEQVLGRLDRDPFRFVRVADSALPDGATRVERVVNLRRDGRSNDMQMHFECLRPGIERAFSITLDLRAEQSAAAARLDSRRAPERAVTLPELIAAVNGFYRQRWEAEQARFYPQPWLRELPRLDDDGFPLLLRVGRFSHFESASVEGLRQGWQPQGKRSMTEGGTRAVVQQGDTKVPFGWLLLVPAGQEERLAAIGRATAQHGRAGQGPVPGASVPGQSAGAAPLVSSLVGRRGLVDEVPVEVERDEGAVLLVRFLEEGDVEEVQRNEFQPEE